MAVQEAEVPLRHAEIVDQFQFGHGRFGACLKITDVDQSRSQRKKKVGHKAGIQTGRDDKGCKDSGSS